MRKIILASASPRRAAILKTLGIDFAVMASGAEDAAGEKKNISCPEKAMALAGLKVSDIASRLRKKGDTGSIVIGADTVVTLEPDSSDTLEKPKNKDDAQRMLKILSGRMHYVITGISLADLSKNTVQNKYEITKVYMADISDEDIAGYIKTEEPMDKAGAYGIQGLGGLFVRKIEGCYFNVVGLPVFLLSQMLKETGFNILKI